MGGVAHFKDTCPLKDVAAVAAVAAVVVALVAGFKNVEGDARWQCNAVVAFLFDVEANKAHALVLVFWLSWGWNRGVIGGALGPRNEHGL